MPSDKEKSNASTKDKKMRTDSAEPATQFNPAASVPPAKTMTDVSSGSVIGAQSVFATFDAAHGLRILDIDYDVTRARRRLENLRANEPKKVTTDTSGGS